METYDLRNKFVTAGFMKRLLAGIIDFAIILLVPYLGKLISFVRLPGLETACGLYYYICLMYYKTTVGGKILGIYTIKSNGEGLSRLRSFLKSTLIFTFLMIGVVIWSINFVLPDSSFLVEPTIALILGSILLISFPMLFNKNKRSLTDIFSGTRVVDKSDCRKTIAPILEG